MSENTVYVFANNQAESVEVLNEHNGEVTVRRADGTLWRIPMLAIYSSTQEIADVPDANWLMVPGKPQKCPYKDCEQPASTTAYYPHPENGAVDVDVCKEHAKEGFPTYADTMNAQACYCGGTKHLHAAECPEA